MDTTGKIFPMRVFIKHKAIEQLKQDAEMSQLCFPLDEELFPELAKTLFQSESNQVLYEQCTSRAEADAIEDEIATDLVTAYLNIRLRQRNPLVQSLNSLLEP